MSCLGSVGAYRCDACGRVVVAASALVEAIGAAGAKLGWRHSLLPIDVVETLRFTGFDCGILSREAVLRPRGAPEV